LTNKILSFLPRFETLKPNESKAQKVKTKHLFMSLEIYFSTFLIKKKVTITML
jgi:hypothetical protein